MHAALYVQHCGYSTTYASPYMQHHTRGVDPPEEEDGVVRPASHEAPQRVVRLELPSRLAAGAPPLGGEDVHRQALHKPALALALRGGQE